MYTLKTSLIFHEFIRLIGAVPKIPDAKYLIKISILEVLLFGYGLFSQIFDIR